MQTAPGIQNLLTEKRILALDGFRGIAILLVISYHYLPFATAGWCGVDLFFVLSGFLITWKLKGSLNNKNYFGYFYLRRVLRIVPLYLLMLVIVFFLIPFIFPALVTPSYKALLTHQGWYWTFTQNLYDAKHGWPANIIIIHFWSLATEMQFYFIWPFVILLTRNKPNTLIIFLLLLIVFANVFRVLGGSFFSFSLIYRYVLLPSRIDAFALGSLLFMLIHKYGEKLKPLFLLIGITAIIALLVLFSFYFDVHYSSPFTRNYGYTLFDLFWAGIMGYILLSRQNIVTRYLFQGKLITKMGKFSYAMYLFHLPIWIAINLCINSLINHRRWSLPYKGFYLPVLIFSVTLLASMLSYYCFEKYFLQKKLSLGNE